MSKMKTGWLPKILSFCFIVFFIFALGIGYSGIKEALTATELNLALEGTCVYPQSVDQEVPDIENNNVVWMQQGNDYYYKIFHSDLSTGSVKQLGKSTAAEKYPAISGNKVIWMDYRSIMDDPTVKNKYAYIFKFYDMYGYDLEKKKEFPICTNPEWQGYGDIHNDKVVYADLRTGSPDIILYDMNTKREYAICMHPAWQGNPVISDRYIIWMDQRSGDYDIYAYDLSTGKEFPVCTAKDNQAYPIINGTKVVWQDKRNGDDDIYMYDLDLRQEVPICTKKGKQQVPDISGNIVIWQDDRNGNWDIYGYNLITEQEFQITNQSADQTFPAISENRIVWVDSRSGHKNIYTATLPDNIINQAKTISRKREILDSSSQTTDQVAWDQVTNQVAEKVSELYAELYCPLATDADIQLLCKPCPYAIDVANEIVRYCCPLASSDVAGSTLICRPCPYPVNVDGKIILRCCPLPQATVSGEALWCYPCPLAQDVDAPIRQWCCPLADAEIGVAGQDQRLLWCRPCPVARELENSQILWCCPLADSTVNSDRLWCWPCPYAIEDNDKTLTMYCCPVAQTGEVMWCRPCPYPLNDNELTPYCCPIAKGTGQEFWCTPCPCATGIDDYLSLFCCPVALSSVDQNLLWCRPCPYAIDVDNKIIRFCCPVAETTVANVALWCQPCPYAIQMEDGTIKRCCPVAPIKICEKVLLCQPCPIACDSPQCVCCPIALYNIDSQVQQLCCPVATATSAESLLWCRPCPYAAEMADSVIKYCCPLASADVAGTPLVCKPCPYAVNVDGKIVLRCCPLAETVTAGELLKCYPCPLANEVDSAVRLWCCPLADAEIGVADQDQRLLWCRPCPIAKEMENGDIFWCCPLADTPVNDDRLWCKPCPYVVQTDNGLRLWCCPIAQSTVAGSAFWCKPCPWPNLVDNELTPYCCPIALGTGQEFWCKPCPYAKDTDPYLTRICCPVALTNVDDSLMWCRPCPYAVTLDNKEIIRFCCPVPQTTIADVTLWCKPCPYAIYMEDGTLVRRCCPVAPVTVAGVTLWCQPCPAACPIATSSDPVQRCYPCRYYDDMERNTWTFSMEQATGSAGYIEADIGYSPEKYKSPIRSVRAHLRKNPNGDVDMDYAKVTAAREFPLGGCEDLNLKLNYLILKQLANKSAGFRVYVGVTAFDSDGNLMGGHAYNLYRYPFSEIIPDSTDVETVPDDWNVLYRSLSKDLPVEWCKVRTLRVELTAMWKSNISVGDFLDVFWDDLSIWGTDCEPINWCCPVACPVSYESAPVQWCAPCRHYDNMELDTWKFNEKYEGLVTFDIDYSKLEKVSPERSIRAYSASWLEVAQSSDQGVVDELEALSAEQGVIEEQSLIDGYAALQATRKFHLYQCEDINLKLYYLIHSKMTYRSAYRRVYVKVVAYDAGRNPMGRHVYILFQNPPEELLPGTTYIGFTPDKWNILQRNLSKDLPIKWCEVRTLEVFLESAGRFPPGRDDLLDVFWDDLLIWGSNCDVVNWCYPCPVSSAYPQYMCCPVASDKIDYNIQRWCCPLATDVENRLLCKPCPYAVNMPGGTVKYCCPVSSATVAG
ncbi:MAG: hypothetical protein ACMUHX_02785, partial [bacterium]